MGPTAIAQHHEATKSRAAPPLSDSNLNDRSPPAISPLKALLGPLHTFPLPGRAYLPPRRHIATKRTTSATDRTVACTIGPHHIRLNNGSPTKIDWHSP